MNTVISITTTPPRLPHIEPTILTLKAQGLPIYLWIPKVFKRRNVAFDGNVPSFCNGINVEVVEDQGPITKLLPALRAGFERIITADDDKLFGPSWASGLIKHSDQDPSSAFAYCGRMLKPSHRDYKPGMCVYGVDGPTEVTIIEGALGALYRSSFFDKSIHNNYAVHFSGDDIAISLHLKERNIPMKVVAPGEPIKTQDAVHRTDPLYKLNFGGGGNRRLLKKNNTRFRLLGLDPNLSKRELRALGK
jgi:hypothetical protein